MCDAAIQTIFRSVIIAKLAYAASAWRGFTKASDRQRIIDALLRRSKRQRYYAVHLPMFEELCENIDNNLFGKTCMNSNHVLHSMLPPQSATSQHYSFKPHSHSLSLNDHDNHLSDCNVITCTPFKQCY